MRKIALPQTTKDGKEIVTREKWDHQMVELENHRYTYRMFVRMRLKKLGIPLGEPVTQDQLTQEILRVQAQKKGLFVR